MESREKPSFVTVPGWGGRPNVYGEYHILILHNVDLQFSIIFDESVL